MDRFTYIATETLGINCQALLGLYQVIVNLFYKPNIHLIKLAANGYRFTYTETSGMNCQALLGLYL